MKTRIQELFADEKYQPQNFEEIAKTLEIEEYQKDELKRILDGLVDDYEIFLSRKSRYILPKDVNIYKGTISIKNPEYGFISSPNFSEDFYVHRNGMNNAFDKDLVVFSIVDFYGTNQDGDFKQEAKVIDVVKRNLKVVVGELKEKKNHYYVDTENPQINKINIIDTLDASVGDIVKAEIVDYKKKPIEGKVIERIGFKNDIGIDILEIAAKFNFPSKFPDEVIEEVEAISEDIREEVNKRKKPNLKNIVTIDGDDAKDLDDAVAIEKLENGNYLLGVYIADVSYYVRENSHVDAEAYDRGTSVYLVNRVIPMLPVRLSNNLCSLNPNTKKLALALEMEIDSTGTVVDSNLFETVIETKYRLSYNNVNKVLDGDKELIDKYQDIHQDILYMNELRDILNQMRQNRGALDFDVLESKVIVDDKGRAIDIEVIDRGISERIIEEFMLIANETVASLIFHMELPFIYRVHDTPSKMKLENFRNISKNLGYKTLKQKINSKQLQEFLADIKEEDDYLKTLLLRSMAKAIYSEINIGHYGLGSSCYTHFTSPIRRYPDLIVHRLLRKYIINHQINADELTGLHTWISNAAEHSSKKERDAIECEYEVEDMKKAEYMESFVGAKLEGKVSSVNRFGLFIQLKNTVEGLVHISKIKGRYLYDSKSMSLLGVNGDSFKLGDKVVVEVTKADKAKREIDFKIVQHTTKREPKKVDKKSKPAKKVTSNRRSRRSRHGEGKYNRKK
ncbi:MAG: ribonuclease R [Bacilli bacterium]